MTVETVTIWSQGIQAFTSLGVLAVAIWAAIVAVNQLRASAITNLYHRFNDQIARDQRRWVYENCVELNNRDNLSQWAEDPKALRNLEGACNDLDWAGLLVERKLLDEKMAIELYGDSLIRSWVVLRHWIHNARDKRRSTLWLWQKFEKLAHKAMKHPRFVDWRSEGVKVYTSRAYVYFDFDTSDILRKEPFDDSDKENNRQK